MSNKNCFVFYRKIQKNYRKNNLIFGKKFLKNQLYLSKICFLLILLENKFDH
jgi:hypothetical protein